MWPEQRDGQMTHCKSHIGAYFCRQWTVNGCVLERGSLLAATTAVWQKQTASILTTMCWVPHLHPHWCYPGFQISQDFINVHFLAKEQWPTLVLSKRINWTDCQFKQKTQTGRMDSNLFQPTWCPPMGLTTVCECVWSEEGGGCELFLHSPEVCAGECECTGWPGCTLLISLMCV